MRILKPICFHVQPKKPWLYVLVDEREFLEKTKITSSGNSWLVAESYESFERPHLT